MFTGIVTAKGRIRSITGNEVRRFDVEAPWKPDTIDMGASIAHAGVCLTVVDKGEWGEGGWYTVEVSPETLNLTTLSEWREGDTVNLERALKMGDELGGHLVTGHVDGVGRVRSGSALFGGQKQRLDRLFLLGFFLLEGFERGDALVEIVRREMGVA